MKKILFIMNNLGGGGAERVLIDILDSFDYSKYEVDLFLVNCEGVYLNEVNKNVNIYKMYGDKHFKNKHLENLYLNLKYRLLKHFPKVMYKLFIKKRYDVEIAFLEGFPCTYLLANSNNKDSKKIAWVHTDLSKSDAISKEDAFRIYSEIDEFICVSKDSEIVFKSLYPYAEDKVRVIYNLINKEAIIRKSNMAVEASNGLPTIVSVGRLVKLKRFDIVIRAHKLLLDEGIENRLIIVGVGEEENELKALIKELKVKESVEMTGFQSNPYPYIKASDIFCMASDFEGFSLVVAEALILGKPIVATSCVGPIELLNNGEYGILTKCGDIEGLKKELKELILSEQIRRYYSNKSLERSNIFQKESIMKEIYEVIEN